MTVVLVMGVAGAGKSSVGSSLAVALHGVFIEGDQYHLPESIAKMRAGIALTDGDRWPWLDAVAEKARSRVSEGSPVVLACSALKQAYRDRLRESIGSLIVVYLHIDAETAAGRLLNRPEHFFHPILAEGQFEILERPEDGIVMDGTLSVDAIVAELVFQLTGR